MTKEGFKRKLTAILSADVAGYSRLMGEDEEAISAFRKFLDLSPGEPATIASLAATYSMLGREEEARAAAAEVLKIDPKFSVEAQRKKSLYKNPEDVKHLYGAQLKAGLPE